MGECESLWIMDANHARAILETALRTAVGSGLKDCAEVSFSDDFDQTYQVAAHLRGGVRPHRVARLVAGGEWFEAQFQEPSVRAVILGSHELDAVEATQALTKLATAIRGYLTGSFVVEHKKRWLRSDSSPVLVIEASTGTWRVRRHSALIPPDGSDTGSREDDQD